MNHHDKDTNDLTNCSPTVDEIVGQDKFSIIIVSNAYSILSRYSIQQS